MGSSNLIQQQFGNTVTGWNILLLLFITSSSALAYLIASFKAAGIAAILYLTTGILSGQKFTINKI
ncbi:MAG: hypothetical protein ABIR81_08655 [Ginsengibacter sp.]